LVLKFSPRPESGVKAAALSKTLARLAGVHEPREASAARSPPLSPVFAEVGKTLTALQKEKLAGMRTTNPADPKGPFLYSSPINLPKIENTDFLFGKR
jgi:hypothetical protein